MSHSEGTASNGIADDIFDVSQYEAARPLETRPFFPWHLPRKQYVRDRQWMLLARAIARSFPPDDGIFRYLGLPGDDLLDIRQLHEEVTNPHDLKLRFVGFNTSAAKQDSGQVDLNISIDEVMKLPGIDPRSVVLPDRFELIGKGNSSAVNTTRNAGTFDVVNLDLCDGFCQAAPSAVSPTYYDAMNVIMGLQQRRTRPWVLLLTTRVDADTVHSAAWPRLADHYDGNLQRSVEFRTRSQALLGVGARADIEPVLSEPVVHGRLVLTAVCKWLASLSIGARSKLLVKSAIGYRVVPEAPAIDIVSVGMWIEPIVSAVPDSAGLSRAAPAPLDESQMALRALEKVCEQQDADEQLSTDAALFDEMKTKMAIALERARYDRAAYLSWLEREQTRRGLVVPA